MAFNKLVLSVLLLALSSNGARAQSPLPQAPKLPAEAKGPAAADPLAVGVAALDHGNYTDAQTFFANYLKDNPNDIDAVFFAGAAALELKQFDVAIADLKRVVAAEPDLWNAHSKLVRAYAQIGDWKSFDAERALIKTARDNNAPDTVKDKFDFIDTIDVGGKTYDVRAFYTLYGNFKTRYVFLHFGDDGKLTDYIQCESDDADQSFFQKSYPKKAAAGERSFSLDTYHLGKAGMSQGLIKFYLDGEPTYETVRADVIKVLQGDNKPAASMTAPNKK